MKKKYRIIGLAVAALLFYRLVDVVKLPVIQAMLGRSLFISLRRPSAFYPSMAGLVSELFSLPFLSEPFFYHCLTCN